MSFRDWKPVKPLVLFHEVAIKSIDTEMTVVFDDISLNKASPDLFRPPASIVELIDQSIQPDAPGNHLNDNAVVIRQVVKSYGSVKAVRRTRGPQRITGGIPRPNGAGKSTTIRMIMSIIYPDHGRIEVLDATAPQAKDRIGYLPEERDFYRKMRINQFLRYVGRLKGLRRQDADIRIEQWLDRLELPDVLHRRCEELSKGQRNSSSSPPCCMSPS